MTAPTTRVTPRELTMIPLTEVDRAVVELMIGEQRTEEMAEVGMAMADRSIMTIDGLLAAVEAGLCRSWIAYHGQRPAAFLMYTPFSLPGVWSGEVITAPDADDLRGAGTAAMACALDLMFAEPGVRRMIGFVAEHNTAALKLIERLGYVRESRSERLLLSKDGTERDAVMVRLHRDEWLGAEALLGGQR